MNKYFSLFLSFMHRKMKEIHYSIHHFGFATQTKKPCKGKIEKFKNFYFFKKKMKVMWCCISYP